MTTANTTNMPTAPNAYAYTQIARANYHEDLLAQLNFAEESIQYYATMFHKTDENDFYSLGLDLWLAERDAILVRIDCLAQKS